MEKYVPSRISVILAKQWVRFLDGHYSVYIVYFLWKTLWIHEQDLLCIVHNNMLKRSFLERFSGKDRKINATPRP